MPARVPRGHFQVFESSRFFSYAERWPSGRRRTPAKGVRVKSPSRVRIPLSPPIFPSKSKYYLVARRKPRHCFGFEAPTLFERIAQRIVTAARDYGTSPIADQKK